MHFTNTIDFDNQLLWDTQYVSHLKYLKHKQNKSELTIRSKLCKKLHM